MPTSISKSALVEQIASKSGLSQKEAGAQVDSVLSTIADHLSQGSEVRISGFGTFDVSKRDARPGRNPSTGETIQIAASKSVKFKPAKDLKDRL